MWLPDSRLEMPELFEPGRKPVGNVEVNWRHTLTKGLQSLVIPDYTRDKVSGSKIVRSALGYAYDNNGCHSVSDRETQTGLSKANSNEVRGLTAISITLLFKSYGALSSGELYGSTRNVVVKCGSGSSRLAMYITSTGFADTYIEVLADNDLAAEGDYVIATLTWSQSSGVKMYSRGKEVPVTIITDNNPAAISSYNAVCNIFSHGNFGSAGPTLNGYFCAVHDRVVNNSEILELHKNPYQFLIPA